MRVFCKLAWKFGTKKKPKKRIKKKNNLMQSFNQTRVFSFPHMNLIPTFVALEDLVSET